MANRSFCPYFPRKIKSPDIVPLDTHVPANVLMTIEPDQNPADQL